MADFCKQCSEEMFGDDYKELAGLCNADQKVTALCEGCGQIEVDHEGVRVGPAQLLQHECGGWMVINRDGEIMTSNPPKYVYVCRDCGKAAHNNGLKGTWP